MHGNCKIKIGFIYLLISSKGQGLRFLIPKVETNHEGIRSKIERLGVPKRLIIARLSVFCVYLNKSSSFTSDWIVFQYALCFTPKEVTMVICTDFLVLVCSLKISLLSRSHAS